MRMQMSGEGSECCATQTACMLRSRKSEQILLRTLCMHHDLRIALAFDIKPAEAGQR